MSVEAFAREAGLPIRDLGLLRSALTHRSFVNEHSEASADNERLEFLGDAALDFLSAALLYRRFPDTDEGKLTRIRSALVCTEQLAAFAQEIGLGEALDDQSGGLRTGPSRGGSIWRVADTSASATRHLEGLRGPES